MEEFLPNVTDDNLEVLQRAGDAGETSQITPSHALPETPIGESRSLVLFFPFNFATTMI